MEAQGEDQVMALQAQNMANVELGNIKQSDLLAGPLQGEPIQRQDGQTNRDTPALCMRAEMGPSAAQRSALAESLGFLDVRVQNCQADLLASAVANIGPFLEDEFSVDGQPMRLQVCNVTITMKDDGPRIYPTSPQPVPAKFVIDQLVLERGDDGFMRIRAEGADSKSSADVPVVGCNNPNSYNHVQQQCDTMKRTPDAGEESGQLQTREKTHKAGEDGDQLITEDKAHDDVYVCVQSDSWKVFFLIYLCSKNVQFFCFCTWCHVPRPLA
ncbi:UHRF1-binding protein 1-like isoform X2 [Melanotaenia boesemani]|uniref:UHRF1-binding protein 1-like isoform X2 n=1 Tax=Melanotaenia boesemani TaxID=1250792 RepID=UPI001C0572A3|nr:UHRF1-binding protein 1-like isoform X2 [Melanotaenia boesemani]